MKIGPTKGSAGTELTVDNAALSLSKDPNTHTHTHTQIPTLVGPVTFPNQVSSSQCRYIISL